MLDIKYTMKERKLVDRIKFEFAPAQLFEYTRDRMIDLNEFALYTSEEFNEVVKNDYENPLEILDFDNDNAHGGSKYIYTEVNKNGYIRGFDTTAEMVNFCVMWLYVHDNLKYDFEDYIKFEESKEDGDVFDTDELRNDYFSIIYR